MAAGIADAPSFVISLLAQPVATRAAIPNVDDASMSNRDGVKRGVRQIPVSIPTLAAAAPSFVRFGVSGMITRTRIRDHHDDAFFLRVDATRPGTENRIRQSALSAVDAQNLPTLAALRRERIIVPSIRVYRGDEVRL